MLIPMSTSAFRYHSIEPEGLWTSEPFPPAERRQIVQGVIAGFLTGHPRWATDLEGNFIYGLDAKGKELSAAPTSTTATPSTRPPAKKKAKGGGLKHWKVKFTRRGMEPPRPFGKTTAVVCAESREAAKQLVPASPNYPITVSATTDPVSFTYRCHHKAQDESESTAETRHHARKKSPAQLDREIAEALAKH